MTRDTIEHATSAWIATVDPATIELATRYTRGNHWLLLWEALVTIALCVLLARSGLLTRLAERMAARGRGRFVTAFVLSTMLLLGLSALALPWDYYADYYREARYGLAGGTAGQWLTEHLIMSVVSALALGLFLALFYRVLQRVRRRRPLWLGTLTAAFLALALLLYPVALAPLFNTFEPAPPGAVREAASALAARAGIPPQQIYLYDGSSQSTRYTASVSGLGGWARIQLSDTMFGEETDLPAVRAVIAHEIGHYAQQHITVMILFFAVFAAVLFAAIERLHPWTARATHRGRAPRFEEPAGLPVIIVLFTLLTLLSTPGLRGFSRWQENRADAYSLNLAREPAGLIRALLRTVDYRAPTPSPLEEWLFYSHPGIAHRIEHALRWEAARNGSGRLPSPASAARPAPMGDGDLR